MKKSIAKNIGGSIGFLLLWMFCDYMYVQSGQSETRIWSKGWMEFITFMVVPIGFFFINGKAFPSKPGPMRYLYVFLLTVGVTLVWYLVCIIIVVNFHLFIGGNL